MTRIKCCYVQIMSCVGMIILMQALAHGETTLSGGPRNAALLYYQAALARPEPGDYRLINDVIENGDPNERVREYLSMRKTQEVLDLMRTASRMAECDWGILCAKGQDLSSKAMGQLQHLGRLLEMQARTVAADGNSRNALECCLTLRRFAAQMGAETPNTYAVSQVLDTRALVCIQHILCSVPSDTGTLTWLRSQLKAVPGTPWHPARTLRAFRDCSLQSLLHESPDPCVIWRDWILNSTDHEKARKEIENLSPGQLLAQARKLYGSFLESAIKTIESPESYDKKHAELQRLVDRLRGRAYEGHPVHILTGSLDDPSALVIPYYERMIHIEARFNATMAALEIYLVQAQTRKLPQTLPAGLPKDPYSGTEFGYEAAADGFVLRCRVQDFDPKVHRYEFTLRDTSGS
jgi:hypothetical protein